MPVDVKYKLYDSKKLAVHDIYQTFLSAFAVGHGELPRAGIVFPATRTITGPALSIRQLAGPSAAKIVAVGLDVPEILEQLQSSGRAQLLVSIRGAIEQLTGLSASAQTPA